MRPSSTPSRYSAPIPTHAPHHHAWWHLTPRPQNFHHPRSHHPRAHKDRRLEDDGAGLGNSIHVALYRQNFNDDLSVTAYEAAHERRDYWRLPPEIRDRIYTDQKEDSIIRSHQNLSMTDTERYHEAIRGSQALDTALPVHMTSMSMSHNALVSNYPALNDLDQQGAMSYLAAQREARNEQAEVFKPVQARPRMW